MQVSAHHAEVVRKENGDYHLMDKGSEKGTWFKGKKISAHQEVKLHPGDNLSFGSEVPECTFQVKLAHHSVEEQLKSYLKKIERVQEQLGESTEVTHKDLAAMN